MKQRIQRGYTFRKPDGSLGKTLYHSVAGAQSGAAFASERPYSHISMPNDWHRAYYQGFRIVSAALAAGPSEKAWKEPQPRTDP